MGRRRDVSGAPTIRAPVGAGRRVLFLALLAAGVVSCFRAPLIPPSLQTVPIVLVPSDLAGIVDARGRFREIYCAVRADHGAALPDDRPCEDVVLRLAGEPPASGRPVALGGPHHRLRVMAVGGLFAQCFTHWASPFADGLAHLRTHGYRAEHIPVDGLSGSAHNAGQIAEAIAQAGLEPGERVLLVGHSKGVADALEALVAFPELTTRVAAVASVAGAVAGSPLADGIRDSYKALLSHMRGPHCDAGDGTAFESISRATRLGFLAAHPLPTAVKYFSIGGIVPPEETSWLLRSAQRRLSRIDPRNDGQLIFTDVVIPGGTLLGFVRADHWAIAMPFSRGADPVVSRLVTHNAFPREVLLEAVVRAVEEAL